MSVKRFIALTVLAIFLAGMIISIIVTIAFLIVKLIEILEDLM